MTVKRTAIPVHKLRESTDQGFRLDRIHPSSENMRKAMLHDVHRDDHYIFLLHESGWSKGTLDFRPLILNAKSIFFILPGQVHHYLDAHSETSGWFVAMDAMLVPDMFRRVLEDPLLSQVPVYAGDRIMLMAQSLQMADTLCRQTSPSTCSRQAVYALLTSFVAMVADEYSRHSSCDTEKVLRSRVITQEFRKLLAHRYKAMKSPGEYAAALTLSVSYLNEAVKDTTGFPVSYWIQQEVLLEAKRLLYHSEQNVKEIAYELGYEDHTYFSRLFKKAIGQTPVAFRRHYRG